MTKSTGVTDPKPAKLEKNSTPSKRRVGAEFVALEMARAIERGEYEPGQRLREQEIADRFGLSRAPVREALRLLESHGLAVIEPMKGARVVFLDDVSFRELLQIRAALSVVIAEFAAAAPPSNLKDKFVEETGQLHTRALDGADAQEIYTGIRQHFQTLSDISTSTRAKVMIASLGAGRSAFQMQGLRTKTRRIQVTRNWHRLAKAVQQGDGKSARRIIQTLYDNASAFLLQNAPSPRLD